MTYVSHTCIATIACLFVVTADTSAQECGAEEVTPWWPRAAFTDGSRSLTASERKTVEARLTAVEALMRKTPYATPRGFAVRPAFEYHEITDRTQLYSYGFSLVTFARCNKYDEHGADITVTFNPDPMAWSLSDRPMLDEAGDGLYVERVRAPAILGAAATFGRFQEENSPSFLLLFTPGNLSPTRPVTREEYVRAMIFTFEGKDAARIQAAATVAAKTPYERWLADAPERKKRNEELFAVIQQVNPAGAAKMRADLEAAEREEGEKLKRNDAYERSQLAKNLAAVTAPGDRLRSALAAMSAEERAAPAFLVGEELVPAGTPNASAIVRKNPAFYRAAGSPLEARVILVRMPGAYKEYRAQQAELFKQLDWAALKQLLY